MRRSSHEVVTIGAVSAAMLLLYVARRRKRQSETNETSADSDVLSLGAAAFAEHAASTVSEPEQCVLRAATAFSVRNFWQGAFSLTEDDLVGTLGASHAAKSVAVLKAAGVTDAYMLRKELVNLKKACLRTYHDVDKVAETMQRQDQYFFRDTSSGHVRGCVALPLRADAPIDLDAHHQEYTSICQHFQRAKGLVLAVNDARDFTKFLCALPRHPDDCERVGGEGVHRRLLEMPASFKGAEAIAQAEDFVAERTGGLARGVPSARVRARAEAGGANAGDGCGVLPPSVLRGGLADVMSAHVKALPSWPSHVHDFVRLSLVARGGAKAVSIRAACGVYYDALRRSHERGARVLAALDQDDQLASARASELGVATWTGATEHVARVRRVNGDDAEPAPPSVTGSVGVAAGHTGDVRRAAGDAVDPDDAERVWLVRRRLLISKHVHKLSALQNANSHLLEILRQLLERHAGGGRAPVSVTVGSGGGSTKASGADSTTATDGQRLFVAGDGLERSMFYPPAFAALRNMVAELAAAARHFAGLQRTAIALEGWPPPPSAMRTRVQVDGAIKCVQCDGGFSRQWIKVEAGLSVCWQCEAVVRADGRCPFDLRQSDAAAQKRGGRGSGKAAAHFGATFCPHQGLCVVCDGGFAPCPECRLAQGDGETAASVCAEWRGTESTMLFFDFDRSLCSTKSGGSPLQGNHSLDSDLADLAAQLPMVVITRNSHRADIRAFLKARGVTCQDVCVVRKGVSKAAAMVEILPRLAEAGGAVRGLFVDDGVRECCDERVAALPGLYRVLFRRGAVV